MVSVQRLKVLKCWFMLFIGLGFGILSSCGDAQDQTLKLSNISKRNIDLPVEWSSENLNLNGSLYEAKAIHDPAQRFFLQKTRPLLIPADGKTHSYCTVIPEAVTSGAYSLVPVRIETTLQLNDDPENGRLHILDEGDPVLVYNYGKQLPSGIPDRYRRSTYIHPLYSPSGVILTDDFPSDHYHHRGLSWMWPKVFIDGVRYDLWHIYGPQAQYPGIHQLFEKWVIKETGPVCATLGVKNRWEIEGGKKVMDEWVLLRIYKSDGPYRAVDLFLTWKPVVPVEIEGADDKGYGGLNFRLAPRKETTLFSSEGREKRDSNLKPLPWADQSGLFENKSDFDGVTIFQSYFNPDYPAGWCLRHYGFLGVAWPGVDRYRLETDKRLELRFRLWIHDGDAEQGQVKEAFHFFKHSPEVSQDESKFK
ncbi:hypothetical protein BVY01_03340 [bacterium I07]|nr:hypothetical protein BVY01_03340 [bacterium I07]